jgi:8-oxo-dGTP pyrophosphatase MutT (NUDIX family)
MTEQLFQIGIKALIRNKDGAILMVHIPEWGHNPAHWDLPGGRMDPGETFLQTLDRELHEEIGVGYAGTPRQFGAVLTNITIPVDDVRYPLVFVVYETQVQNVAAIHLDPESAEEAYEWFTPQEAAEHMGVKFTADFCGKVRDLA